MEYVKQGDLFGYISRGVVGEETIKSVIWQLLKSLQCLHKLGVVHRDIKLENALITEDGIVKLIDFGTAVKMGTTTTPCLSLCCGSSNYIAPEILGTKTGRTKRYGQEVDLWSLGVLTYAMLFNTYPFDPSIPSRETAAYAIPMAPCRSQASISFVSQLLQVSPEMRLTISEALQHEWFTGGNNNVARPGF
eukprot:TRINITY_DN34665_c0_g1_i1.p1 TRINITY_DN34665_c0_g1~~TRINITY_DN34665_c0_g1_i1.p1  ORF type:complete len:191 (+),score=9.60 TRINITY_DN34665_c0_g1_i1:1-573(+)